MNKKMVFVLAMVVVIVFATASVAMAAWGDNTYASAVDSGTTGSDSPHGPYNTTSKKCAVCHSVHNADPNGYILLRVQSGDPCIYCHVSSNVGQKVVYAGQSNYYTTDASNAHNFVDGKFGCTSCHTVHGAGGVDASSGAGWDSVTNLRAQSEIATDAVEANRYTDYGAYTNTGTSVADLSQWCSGCHPYYNTAFNGRTHVMTSAIATYGNASASADPRAKQVAFASSEDCKSCHASNSIDTLSPRGSAAGYLTSYNFPHITDGDRFLVSGASTDTATYTPDGEADFDGVCLRCHYDSSSAGVGGNF